jgi:hypothetical protein
LLFDILIFRDERRCSPARTFESKSHKIYLPSAKSPSFFILLDKIEDIVPVIKNSQGTPVWQRIRLKQRKGGALLLPPTTSDISSDRIETWQEFIQTINISALHPSKGPFMELF